MNQEQEKRFDKSKYDFVNIPSYGECELNEDSIKSFISTLLSAQKKEFVGMLRGLKMYYSEDKRALTPLSSMNAQIDKAIKKLEEK